MQTSTNLTSKTEGPGWVPSGALARASAGTGNRRSLDLSRFSAFHTRRLGAGISLSTDRADAGPTDKG